MPGMYDLNASLAGIFHHQQAQRVIGEGRQRREGQHKGARAFAVRIMRVSCQSDAGGCPVCKENGGGPEKFLALPGFRHLVDGPPYQSRPKL